MTGGTELRFLATKTDRSTRQLVIPSFAAERLRQQRTEQMERRLAMGEQWSSFGAEHGGLVCERGDDAAFDPDSFGHAFRKTAAQAGLSPRVRLHDLRHAVATALLLQGVPTGVASAQLGHSNPAFTMRVYQHVTDQLRVQAREALERAPRGAGTGA